MADYMKDGVDQIEVVAQKVIKKHFNKLANIKVGYRFTDKLKQSKGRVIHADVKKVPGIWQSFIDKDLILIVAEDDWNKSDGRTREAMIHEGFCQIYLEPKPVGDGYPKQIGKDLYQLSNGEKVQGIRVAKEAEEELSDYKISIVAYDERVISKNVQAYGCWKQSQKGLKQTFVQTRMFKNESLKMAN
ncbi:putative metallopeptidase [Orenia marismortui]|uniref:Putative phage metallopeptidase domain-containing protein n=1 Tax=Orenia marismortui TaxID=46469 RepID=A0A4R8GZH8_9FIRM|nr:putative metallopeptidase [Orenia marismortui]TDX52157.1 hypothetical protein C7959_10879 [Orenia marismortui]